MVHRFFLRLLSLVLAVILLAAPVAADSAQRLSVEREVYRYLTEDLRLSTAAACGVLANIEHESSFQPTVFGDRGTSFGLCQWHDDRFTALRSYCAALGLDYRTVKGQLAYLRYELGTNYAKLLLTLQAIDDTPEGAYRAAYLWCVEFEKPSNMQAKAHQRGELAQGKYWARYSNYTPIDMTPAEPEPAPPDPNTLIEQLRQNPVTIPLPPEETREQTGSVRHYRFEKPAFVYYVPHHLPTQETPESPKNLPWEIPTLAAIAAAMVIVVIFPNKKPSSSLYRRGKVMVE